MAGGYTAVLLTGVARQVLHVDVTSLYPSLMLARRHRPGGGLAGRLPQAPRATSGSSAWRPSGSRARRPSPAEERTLAGALQQTFKILINSFYGYLAFSQGHWNDYDAANQVTGEGRDLVQAPGRPARRAGGRGDRGGHRRHLLRRRPAWTADEEALCSPTLEAVLPAGIQLELDGRYEAMLSYKMKNYVLLDARGKLLIKGSGLRSRGIELFQRLWLEEMFRLLLSGRREEIPALVARWREDFEAHRVPVKQFMKTETLQESSGRLPGQDPDGQAQSLGRLRARASLGSGPISPATRCPTTSAATASASR